MFTGIVQDVGEIHALETRADDLRLCVRVGELDLEPLALGESIAVAGVCLTLVERREKLFWADVSRETLACTTIGDWRVGRRVNLECAVRAGQTLGGHLVAGHVDGIAELLAFEPDGRSQRLLAQAPPALARYLAPKGSVTLDGVSLTVNAVQGGQLQVNLVPHTLQVTTLGTLARGARLNLEVDLVARYVERLLSGC